MTSEDFAAFLAAAGAAHERIVRTLEREIAALTDRLEQYRQRVETLARDRDRATGELTAATATIESLRAQLALYQDPDASAVIAVHRETIPGRRGALPRSARSPDRC